MIKCKFQYMFSTSGSSDSQIVEINVNVLPRIDEILFINNGSKSKVVDIIHEINTTNGEHITTIQYKEVN